MPGLSGSDEERAARSDAATLRHRLASRASGRDTAKLADFGAFTARMRLDDRPPAPHAVIDNRLTATMTMEEQVTLLTGGEGHQVP